jgi:hypothetical protein
MPLINPSFSPERSPSWTTVSDAEKANAVFNASGILAFSNVSQLHLQDPQRRAAYIIMYTNSFDHTYQPARFEDSTRGFCGRDVDDPEHT